MDYQVRGVSKSVLALSAARMADALGNSTMFVILPLYVVELERPDLAVPVLVGVLISLYGFLAAFLQPVVGGVSDWIGRRKILILAGMVLMGGCTLGYIAAEQYFHLVYLRLLQAVGLALTIPTSLTILAAATERSTRGSAMGFYSTSRMAGFAAGPLLGGLLHTQFGFTAAFSAGGIFILLSLILVHRWVREPAIAIPSDGPKFQFLDRTLLHPGILSAAGAVFVMAFCFSLIIAVENEFNARLDMDAFWFGFAFSAVMFGRLAFQIPLGNLSDRIGRKPLIGAGLVLLGPSTGLLGFVSSVPELVLLRFMQGIGSAAIVAPALALTMDLSSAGGEGRQMSLTTMGFGLGIAAGPLVGGLLGVLSLELPFLAGGVLALLYLAVVLKHMKD